MDRAQQACQGNLQICFLISAALKMPGMGPRAGLIKQIKFHIACPAASLHYE